SLSSASRYFGFSAANWPTRSCTSPRVIACDIVVSLLVAVRCCGCRCSRAARRASGEALHEASKPQRLKASKAQSSEASKAGRPEARDRKPGLAASQPCSLAVLQSCSLAVLQPRLEVDLRDGVAQARAHDGALGLDVLLAAGDLLEIGVAQLTFGRRVRDHDVDRVSRVGHCLDLDAAEARVELLLDDALRILEQCITVLRVLRCELADEVLHFTAAH